jgi:hypothetical protein
MSRLLVHVEGWTEVDFVTKVLRDHLVSKGYHSVEARIVGNPRLSRWRGGIRPWPTVREGIVNHLNEDRGCVSTTMVDYYALPQGDSRGWPGRAQSSSLRTVEEKAQCVQNAVRVDVAAAMGNRFDPKRFVPFVVMHEFEGLLFSDCGAFSRATGRPDLESGLRGIRAQFETPEEINDSPVTAPSKRIEALMPQYAKVLSGTQAVLEIGLAQIRAECPHFSGWLKQLEALVRN